MTGHYPPVDPSDTLHPPSILASYEAALSNPASVEACCEDYRQSAPGGLDFEHDQADRAQGNKIQVPLRVIWGQRGVIEGVWGREKVLKMWKGVASKVDPGSKSVDSGHYIPEEVVSGPRPGRGERGKRLTSIDLPHFIPTSVSSPTSWWKKCFSSSHSSAKDERGLCRLKRV